MISEYVGLAEKVRSGYSVFFPDFPGFGSHGNKLEDTRKNARDGLIAHIELMIEDGELLPKPTLIDEVIKMPDARGCIPLLISVIVPAGKAQRINITMDRSLIKAIDSVAHHQHKTRSALLAEAAHRLLGNV